MKTKINNSTDFDLDLFFRVGIYNVHIATAGLHLNDDTFFDDSHNEYRFYIKNLFFSKGFEYKLNPNLDEILAFKQRNNLVFDKETYIKDFVNYAKMGLFSFDRTYINSYDDFQFHLVAYPILNDTYENIFFEKLKINYNNDFSDLNSKIENVILNNLNKTLTLDFIFDHPTLTKEKQIN